MDPKKDAKADPLADLNLASLMQRREEAVKKQREAMQRVQTAKADHFLLFWLGGGGMLLAALWLAQALPEYTPLGMFLLSACIIGWVWMWIAAFFSAAAVRRVQDRATAAARQVMEIDRKIEFCHQVLEEAKRARVRRSAQALIDREVAAPNKAAAG
jgi:hypothetical protein